MRTSTAEYFVESTTGSGLGASFFSASASSNAFCASSTIPCSPSSSAFFSFSFISSCVRASGATTGRGASAGGLGSGWGSEALSLLKASNRSIDCLSALLVLNSSTSSKARILRSVFPSRSS
uniref:Uncharacterized protein n=1 Tax=Opuntia streptacantha TaxID=393608 RepID=A0A7C9D3U4_OPUST